MSSLIHGDVQQEGLPEKKATLPPIKNPRDVEYGLCPVATTPAGIRDLVILLKFKENQHFCKFIPWPEAGDPMGGSGRVFQAPAAPGNFKEALTAQIFQISTAERLNQTLGA